MVAIGEGRTSSEGQIVPCPFKPGDTVKFLEYAPVEIKVSSDAAWHGVGTDSTVGRLRSSPPHKNRE